MEKRKNRFFFKFVDIKDCDICIAWKILNNGKSCEESDSGRA